MDALAGTDNLNLGRGVGNDPDIKLSPTAVANTIGILNAQAGGD